MKRQKKIKKIIWKYNNWISFSYNPSPFVYLSSSVWICRMNRKKSCNYHKNKDQLSKLYENTITYLQIQGRQPGKLHDKILKLNTSWLKTVILNNFEFSDIHFYEITYIIAHISMQAFLLTFAYITQLTIILKTYQRRLYILYCHLVNQRFITVFVLLWMVDLDP